MARIAHQHVDLGRAAIEQLRTCPAQGKTLRLVQFSATLICRSSEECMNSGMNR